MRTTTRIWATAAVGLGLAAVLATPAQAYIQVQANDDQATWTRADPTGCFTIDVRANDSDPRGSVSDFDMASGFASVKRAPVQVAEVCPSPGLRAGDVLVFTYQMQASDNPSTDTATVTVAVGGPDFKAVQLQAEVVAGSAQSVSVSPAGSPAVTWVQTADEKSATNDAQADLGATISPDGTSIVITPPMLMSGKQELRYALADGTAGTLELTVAPGESLAPLELSVIAGQGEAFSPITGGTDPITSIWADDPAVVTELNAWIDVDDPTTVDIYPSEWTAGVYELHYATAATQGLITVTVVDPNAPAPSATPTAPVPNKDATTTKASDGGSNVPLMAGAGVGALALVGGAFALGRRRSLVNH